jgi:hypothetical protein
VNSAIAQAKIRSSYRSHDTNGSGETSFTEKSTGVQGATIQMMKYLQCRGAALGLALCTENSVFS